MKKKAKVNRGLVAEIDLQAFQHNLKILKKIVGKRTIIAVVKADAYGHGAVQISGMLMKEGLSFLAVAYSGEARLLRESGISAQILVLFDKTDIHDYFHFNLIPVIHDIKTAVAFSKEAQRRGVGIQVHLKIDTGMGRLGIYHEKAVSEAAEISRLPGIEIAGLLSHFSEADLSDRSYAIYQMNRFNTIRKELTKIIGRPLMSHMANSAAILSLERALLDAVRPGLMLYGYSPFEKDYGLKPVMSIKSRVLALRKVPSGTPISYGRTFITKRASKIAVIPAGYADGYNRLFSNNADVLIQGKRAPVIGRVCMDITMADVTDVKDVSEGDEVVILGKQGKEKITAYELSSRTNTIPYEIITSFGRSLQKEYIS